MLPHVVPRRPESQKFIPTPWAALAALLPCTALLSCTAIPGALQDLKDTGFEEHRNQVALTNKLCLSTDAQSIALQHRGSRPHSVAPKLAVFHTREQLAGIFSPEDTSAPSPSNGPQQKDYFLLAQRFPNPQVQDRFFGVGSGRTNILSPSTWRPFPEKPQERSNPWKFLAPPALTREDRGGAILANNPDPIGFKRCMA